MVLVAAPELDPAFSCRLLLGSQDLAEWLEVNEQLVGWKDHDAYSHLLQWLQSSDPSSNKVIGLTQRSYDLISHHIETLVETVPRILRCTACGTSHETFKSLEETITESEIYCSWYLLWICPNGHILYRALREMHISLSD